MLLRVNQFDVVNGVVVDWMHCVLLGVTKQMLGYWMLSSNRGNPFYIGDKVYI